MIARFLRKQMQESNLELRFTQNRVAAISFSLGNLVMFLSLPGLLMAASTGETLGPSKRSIAEGGNLFERAGGSGNLSCHLDIEEPGNFYVFQHHAQLDPFGLSGTCSEIGQQVEVLSKRGNIEVIHGTTTCEDDGRWGSIFNLSRALEGYHHVVARTRGCEDRFLLETDMSYPLVSINTTSEQASAECQAAIARGDALPKFKVRGECSERRNLVMLFYDIAGAATCKINQTWEFEFTCPSSSENLEFQMVHYKNLATGDAIPVYVNDELFIDLDNKNTFQRKISSGTHTRR